MCDKATNKGHGFQGHGFDFVTFIDEKNVDKVIESTTFTKSEDDRVGVKNTVPRQEIEKPDRRVLYLSDHAAFDKRTYDRSRWSGPGGTETSEKVFVGGPDCNASPLGGVFRDF